MKKDAHEEFDYFIKTMVDIHKEMNISDGEFVIEECSELIKALQKAKRDKGNINQILGESADVLVTIFVMMTALGADPSKVKRYMRNKMKRAIYRWEDHKEK